MNPLPAASLEATRQRILDAAMARFTRYGYNKTTMAEIARDCDMSAANLYRYFQHKLAIGEFLACNALDEKLALMEGIIQQSGRSAGDRLQDLVLAVLDYTHRQWSAMPHINELVTAICAERREIVEHYRQREQALLIALIEDGQQHGEFALASPAQAATALATAMVLFAHPLLMPLQPLPELRDRAQAVVQLMLSGLRTRNK